VGFVVSKAVGPAVTRNLVKRRLRHLMRARVEHLRAGDLLVVRAQRAAAVASYRDLEAELDRCLDRVVGS
jgi:ribonuclease P protein component